MSWQNNHASKRKFARQQAKAEKREGKPVRRDIVVIPRLKQGVL